ncbi:MAG: hypothetical protein GY866_40605 [Proteobacteria bacterium]|nr:hypothetical protein [Pseudomonadota bacterium]
MDSKQIVGKSTLLEEVRAVEDVVSISKKAKRVRFVREFCSGRNGIVRFLKKKTPSRAIRNTGGYLPSYKLTN